MSENQTMYAQNKYLADVFKGCEHDCVYCKPSFQRQAKRQMHRCHLCYTFTPHFHPERLAKKSPKTIGDQFVFFPKGGDIMFASINELRVMRKYVEDNPQTRFLMQSKDPRAFLELKPYPANLILGITLESNRTSYNTPSIYSQYPTISKAPLLEQRAQWFHDIPHEHKFVTVEPILQFDHIVMMDWLRSLKPEAIYIGYDTKGCHLPEPTRDQTMSLVADLRGEGFTVRLKTIRKAWYEGQKTLTEVI